MLKVDITLDSDLLFKLQDYLKMVGAGALPNTKSAFNLATKKIQKAWRLWAMGETIQGADDIKNPNATLAGSITIQKNSTFDAFIGTDSPYAKRIQQGVRGFDMKEKYPYGERSRVSKKGVPYLIIPFKWGTNNGGKGRAHFGNTIDKESAKIIQSKNFQRSYTTGEIHLEPNARGQQIERQEYDWGDRLQTQDEGDWQNGMVKMNSKSQSQYFTFRIISAKSPQDKWQRKPIQPNDVVGALKKNITPQIQKDMEEGFLRDLGMQN